MRKAAPKVKAAVAARAAAKHEPLIPALDDAEGGVLVIEEFEEEEFEEEPFAEEEEDLHPEHPEEY